VGNTRPLLIIGSMREGLLKAARQMGLFEEAKHPRRAKGSGKGGQFAPKGTAAPVSADRKRVSEPEAPAAGGPLGSASSASWQAPLDKELKSAQQSHDDGLGGSLWDELAESAFEMAYASGGKSQEGQVRRMAQELRDDGASGAAIEHLIETARRAGMARRQSEQGGSKAPK